MANLCSYSFRDKIAKEHVCNPFWEIQDLPLNKKMQCNCGLFLGPKNCLKILRFYLFISECCGCSRQPLHTWLLYLQEGFVSELDSTEAVRTVIHFTVINTCNNQVFHDKEI